MQHGKQEQVLSRSNHMGYQMLYSASALPSCSHLSLCWLQMHTAMLLHFTYITPHRQPFDAHPRITVKKRAMTRAQPASSSSSR